MTDLIDARLGDSRVRAEIESIVDRIRIPGRIKALAQVALRCTCPGVPDCYRGCELWDLSLVDPDNRRPVDFDLRARLLAETDELDAAAIRASIEDPDDPGRAKIRLIRDLLRLRADRPAPFGADSTYEPVVTHDPERDRIVAFRRGSADGREAVFVAVPRFVVRDFEAAVIELPEPPAGTTWRTLVSGIVVDPGLRVFGEVAADAPSPIVVLVAVPNRKDGSA